jgi:hypothetical protein
MFQPLTWMTQGSVLCAPGEVGSVEDLQGQPVASYPLASDLMAYWQALLFDRYGSPVTELFDLKPTPDPEKLLLDGSVRAALISGYTWAKLRESGLRIVTGLRSEWDRAAGDGSMPVMGGLVGRGDWLEENRGLAEAIAFRLSAGLDLYRKDRGAFLAAAASWKWIDSVLRMSEDEVAYWCAYWGMDALDEDRLSFNRKDDENLILLERLMQRAGCI